MVGRQSICLRRLAAGARAAIVGFGRFLSNPRVTVEALVEGWGAQTSLACASRHVLAIQDTSEINFATTPETRRGLGEIGKGSGRGVLLHAMLAVEAETGGVLGLVAGRVWTRNGRVKTHHSKRSLTDKESERWLTTGEAAKPVLAAAAMVTEVSDREADIYAKWASLPGSNFHLLTRAMHDRATADGGRLSTASLLPAGEADIELRERPAGGRRKQARLARTAHLVARFGEVVLKRPQDQPDNKGLAKTVKVSLIEVSEPSPPAGAEPVLWRLLTTHAVNDAEMAWRIVGWYRQRWTIEQLFRTLKNQGLKLEDSQLEDAERLIKLVAVATRAATIIMQLVQARDGRSGQSADLVFSPHEIDVLQALVPQLEGKTALQKNPHPPRTLAWAAWVIAKLGGWDGYPKSKPPGPITFRHGLEHFQTLVKGWTLRDV
jgi:hypothetical protein